MKKWVIFFVLFAFFVSFSFAAYLFICRADFASAHLSQLFGTKATVKNVSWSAKGVDFHNVTIYNPPSSSIKTAFFAKTIQVRMDLVEQCVYFFGYRPALIRKISIDKPFFGMEFINASGSDSNWKILLENAVKNSESSDKLRKYHLKQLFLENVATEIKANGKLRHPKPIKKIEMGQVEKAQAITADMLLYGTLKMTLVQIAEAQNLPEFRKALNDLPPLFAPHHIEIKKRKADTNKKVDTSPLPVTKQPVAALNSL